MAMPKMTLKQPYSNSNNNDNENDISNINVVGSYTLQQRRRRCATNGWLTMVFLAYAFLLTVRVHFTYSMMVMMNAPLAAGPADLQPCPGAVLNVGRNSTVVVARRLDWTIREQAVTMGAYFFGTLVSILPGGMYSSYGYERSIMMWCVALTAATMALVPVAFVQYESWVAVTFLRFLQGFPKNPVIRLKWLEACKFNESDILPNRKLCSFHFEEHSYTGQHKKFIKCGAIPTLHMKKCAFGPTGSCGGTLAGKIIPKSNRILYTTFMFSGTMFGGFMGNFYSGLVIPNVSLDGSYLALSVIGFVWVTVWATMMHLTPYDSDLNSIPLSVSFISTTWTTIIRSMPFISLLNASFGLGFLYSFITSWLPIYTANVLGGDAVRNGIPVSVTWIVGWITSIIAGISAGSLTNVDAITKTTVTKMYVGIVLIGSPIMLFGAMVAGCNSAYVKTFTRTSVILLGFERSSIRINSMDLCPGYVGSLIAMCDIFYSMGNIIDLVVVRSLFADTMNWSVTFEVTIIVSISCSILFLFFGSSLQQC